MADEKYIPNGIQEFWKKYPNWSIETNINGTGGMSPTLGKAIIRDENNRIVVTAHATASDVVRLEKYVIERALSFLPSE